MIRFLQRLMGITPPEPPPTGRAEVNGVKYEVDTISRNETAISIHPPRHKLVVPPANYRKGDETFQRDHRFGPLIDCLFKLRANAVDIGTRDSKLAATLDHRFVSFDKSVLDWPKQYPPPKPDPRDVPESSSCSWTIENHSLGPRDHNRYALEMACFAQTCTF